MKKRPNRLKVALIVGPTAIGKSRIAVKVAKNFTAEIVSADAFQVYEGLNIGTAKISADEMDGIPHHMIDIVKPVENYSVAKYQSQARAVISDILDREHLPIVVGGSGLYVRAAIDDLRFPKETASNDNRHALKEMDKDDLLRMLKELDTEATNTIDIDNKRRIIRSIEKASSGYGTQPFVWDKFESIFDTLIIGLNRDRDDLYRQIDQRVDDMLEEGLIEEVRHLLDIGLKPEMTAAQALGYKQVISFMSGQISQDEMVKQIKQKTRNFAKRQLTWFRADSRVEWQDVSNAVIIDKIVNRIGEWQRS